MRDFTSHSFLPLRSEHFPQHGNFAVAYHPDADGFGALALLVRALPQAHFVIFSVDGPNRDLDPSQFQRMLGMLQGGYLPVFLDHTPASSLQMQEIIRLQTPLYIDHHAMPDSFQAFLPQIRTHHPVFFDPARHDAYATGLQAFQIFGEHSSELPFVLLSLLGDNKLHGWPLLRTLCPELIEPLQELAFEINLAGLTRPCGGYQPHLTDALFEEAFFKCLSAFREGGFQAFIRMFSSTLLAKRARQLRNKIDQQKQFVYQSILQKQRHIRIDDPCDILPPVLLKWAFQEFDFSGPFLFFQVDSLAHQVHFALMQKHSSFHCAHAIQSHPLLKGGGHFDRAGAVGLEDDLPAILQSFSFAGV